MAARESYKTRLIYKPNKIGIMLLPLMPKTADYILKVLKTDDSSFASLETFTPLIGEIGVCEPLFVRIADK